ncbi:MAG: SIMPL domain-containing protein [Anaerolineales bacterium]|nr:SIMPL domain-containing protein [Anaerolineales bacterium]
MLTFKRLSAAIVTGVLGLSLLTACAAPAVVTGSEPGQTHNTISVSGSGQAFGRPDLAIVQIGVSSSGPDLGETLAQNNRRADAILAALKALGIEDKDLQTSNFSIYPQRDYDPQTGQPKDTITYHVDNTLSVTVRDLSKLSRVLSEAVTAGANHIHGIAFSVADPAALEAEARAKAMADARARAEQLAKAAGVTLGSPISISESFNYAPPTPLALDRAAAEAVSAVPIATGQLQVSIQVNVTYEIR